MAASDTNSAPVPVHRELTKWHIWPGALVFVIVVPASAQNLMLAILGPVHSAAFMGGLFGFVVFAALCFRRANMKKERLWRSPCASCRKYGEPPFRIRKSGGRKQFVAEGWTCNNCGHQQQPGRNGATGMSRKAKEGRAAWNVGENLILVAYILTFLQYILGNSIFKFTSFTYFDQPEGQGFLKGVNFVNDELIQFTSWYCPAIAICLFWMARWRRVLGIIVAPAILVIAQLFY